MWQSKQSCHWWDCNAQGACTSMPMLVQRALNNLLTLSNGTLAGPEACRQHEELSPDNNFDILAPPGSSWLSWLLLVILIILAPPGYPGHPEEPGGFEDHEWRSQEESGGLEVHNWRSQEELESRIMQRQTTFNGGAVVSRICTSSGRRPHKSALDNFAFGSLLWMTRFWKSSLKRVYAHCSRQFLLRKCSPRRGPSRLPLM